MNKRDFLKNLFAGSVIATVEPTTGIASSPETHVNNFLSTVDPIHIREGKHYTMTAKGVKCKLCPSECTPKPFQHGNCHTRFEKEGKMITTGYGNPAAVFVDTPEKLHLYHFHPGSNIFSMGVAGCNLACLNCNTWSISQVAPDKTINQKLMPDEVVLKAKENNCNTIAFAYTEPVIVFEYVYDTAKKAKENGLKTIFASCGYIQEKPLRELAPFLDAVIIDIKSFDQKVYEKLNAGKLQPVLDTLKIFKELKIWMELSYLVIPSWNDSEEKIKEMCGWLVSNGFIDYPMHFMRFQPDYKLKNIPATSADMLENFRKIAMAAGIKYVYVDNMPGSASSDTFCPGCKKILAERKGFKILSNIISDNYCPACKSKIPGVWKK